MVPHRLLLGPVIVTLLLRPFPPLLNEEVTINYKLQDNVSLYIA